MKLALIQQHAGTDPEENIERGLKSVREAAGQGASVAAFAEVAFDRFFPQRPAADQPEPWCEPIPGPLTERFQALARELGIVLVLNLFERDGDRRFDSSPVIDSDGSLLGVTRMLHIMEGKCYHEQGFYAPGDRGAPVYETAAGRIGVVICYDRHYPEVMRAMGLAGAELVIVPQAGAVDEWPEGLFEAEMRVAAFQNGYFAALVNRVGKEDCLEFAGESFACDPAGQVLDQAPRGEDGILYVEIDLGQVEQSHARRHFLADRRPEIYPLA